MIELKSGVVTKHPSDLLARRLRDEVASEKGARSPNRTKNQCSIVQKCSKWDSGSTSPEEERGQMVVGE